MSVLVATRRALLGAQGIRWLLRDEFTDTRVAGAVNGTPATPGPGTRTATETDGQFTIGGGVFNYPTQGTPAWGDLGLRYRDITVTRTAGRLLMWTENKTITGAPHGSLVMIGDDSGVVWNDVVDQLGLSMQAVVAVNTVLGRTVLLDTVSIATAYQFVIVMRTTGSYYFIKGGAFTNWTLMWVSSTGATASGIVTLANYNAVGTVDSIRIPDVLWLPQPAVFDGFSRANGPLGSSETTGPDSQGAPVRAWTANVGTWAIAGNMATCSVLAGGIGITTVDTATVNVVMQGPITRAGNEVGIILRYVDADNYIRAIHDGTNMKLIKRVATAETDVISVVVALGAGAAAVVADGTTFRLYLNDAQVGATSTIADAALQTGTRQGLYSTNTGNTMDAFLVMPRGGGAYSALDRWSS